MWSNASLPGGISVSIRNLSENRSGWENEFCIRLENTLQRHGFELKPEGNCLVLIGSSSGICGEWNRLAQGEKPRLIIVYAAPHIPELEEQVLQSSAEAFPFRITNASDVAPRAAHLYILKFFVELYLHSAGSISGKMVWFAAAKARELLRKRRYQGTFSTRC
jgi:hypothetical protein